MQMPERRTELKPCPFCGRPLTEKAWTELERNLGRNQTPPNPPLTLDELQEMDGETVWFRRNGPTQWYISDGRLLDGIPFFTPEIGYGKQWEAYRRRSEEAQR